MPRLGLLLLLVSLHAGAATYWADLAGVGSGDGKGTGPDDLCAGITDSDCAEQSGDTVYLCNHSTSQLAAASQVNGVTYDWTCPGGTPGRITTSGTTAALTLGTRTDVTHVDLNVSQTGTGQCVNMTGAKRITFRGGGVCSNCGTLDASWNNDNELGVIGPCGSNAIGSGAGDADDITIEGLHIHDTGSHAILSNPTSAIDLDGWTIRDNLFERCGDAQGESCVFPTLNADSGATYTDYVTQHNLFIKPAGLAVRYAGEDGENNPTFINPVMEYMTCIDCNTVYGSGSAFQLHDSDGGRMQYLACDRPHGDGGCVASYYSTDLYIADVWCRDTTYVEGQVNGNFCWDVDLGNDGVLVERIFGIDSPGLESVSGCSGGQSCSGIFGAIIGSRNVTASDLISVRARVGVLISEPNESPFSMEGITLCHAALVDSIDNALIISASVDVENSITVCNTAFVGTGGVALRNDSGLAQIALNNLYWNNETDRSGQDAEAVAVEADPKWIGGPTPATLYGFRLRPDSPAIDAGAIVLPFKDFTGRQFAGAPEVGPFAYQGGEPRPTLTPRATLTPRSTLIPRTLDAR